MKAIIIMGSTSDEPHVKKITDALDALDVCNAIPCVTKPTAYHNPTSIPPVTTSLFVSLRKRSGERLRNPTKNRSVVIMFALTLSCMYFVVT